jgi:hypothetical protein
MKKIVKLNESELINFIKKFIAEEESEDDFNDNNFTVEPNVNMIPREKQLQGMFGKYEDQVPNDVLRYLRKNPQLIMNRLVKIYGDRFLEFAEKAYIKNYKIK